MPAKGSDDDDEPDGGESSGSLGAQRPRTPSKASTTQATTGGAETENAQQEPNKKAGANAAQHASSSATSTRTYEGQPTVKQSDVKRTRYGGTKKKRAPLFFTSS